MALIIGTRKSKLALVQTHFIRDQLQALYPDLVLQLEHITTKGDVILDRPLASIGDKGLFVTEIEDAMREGEIDLAVHSAKDLPSVLTPDMAIGAYPRRVDPRDVLISREGHLFHELPAGAVIGTSSPRRACQILHLRADLEIRSIRGNVDTRLRKLHEGQYDAIVLAAAGLLRLKLEDQITQWFTLEEMVPAVSQGILAIEMRAGDERVAQLLQPLDDPLARAMATAEKAVLAQIGGGCQVAVGAQAQYVDHQLVLCAMIGATDGRLVRDTLTGSLDAAATLGATLAHQLLDSGGRELLKA